MNGAVIEQRWRPLTGTSSVASLLPKLIQLCQQNKPTLGPKVTPSLKETIFLHSSWTEDRNTSKVTKGSNENWAPIRSPLTLLPK